MQDLCLVISESCSACQEDIGGRKAAFVKITACHTPVHVLSADAAAFVSRGGEAGVRGGLLVQAPGI